MATTRTQSVNGGVRRDLFAHAIRGGHTLCGLTVKTYPWTPIDDVDSCPRCFDCASVPLGHATSRDLMDLGLTHRQVDFWVRQGHLKAVQPSPGSGYHRSFPPPEFAVAVRMAELVRAGILPAAACRAARNGGQLAPGVRIVIEEAAA
jgi:hypothetical protein